MADGEKRVAEDTAHLAGCGPLCPQTWYPSSPPGLPGMAALPRKALLGLED